MDNYQCLASLALFSQLYNKNQNVYDVLAEFLKYLISVDNINPFNLTEISNKLNQTFSFKIPEAVVKTVLKSLKRKGFLSQSVDGQYSVVGSQDYQNISIMRNTYDETRKEHQNILDALFLYIEDQDKEKLTEEKKKIVMDNFCSYMLNNNSIIGYSAYISAFILDKRNQPNFTDNLNAIKEGVILYSGLKYTLDPHNVGSWNTDLVIFLDIEVLFYYAGYNGVLYKALFDDFFALVKEINNASIAKNGNAKIKLKYFKETENEINGFFAKAEQIIVQQVALDPSKTAMCEIVKGCKDKSEVLAKKTHFYQNLKTSGIMPDDFDNYYKKEYEAFNLMDKAFVKSLLADDTIPVKFKEQDYVDSLHLLSHINVLRRGEPNVGIESVRYIFMTGKNVCNFLAWHKEIKNEKGVPLATSLDFLTDKFWYKLNKGFGGKTFPLIFNVITKAQLILSSYVNNSVGRRYDDLRHQYDNKQLTKEVAIAQLVDLRKQVVRPEELSEPKDFDSLLQFIKEEDIENSLRERELLKRRAEDAEKVNEELKQILNKKEKEQKQVDEELKFYKEYKLKLDQKKNIDRETTKKIMGTIRKILVVCEILIIIVVCFKYNLIMGLVSIVGSIGGFIFLKEKIKSFWDSLK